MEDNFATRLKVFMDSKEMSSSQFADLCEIPRPSFSQLLSGRNKKVSDVVYGKIHEAFPDLSITWLMFGDGEMLTSQKPIQDSEHQTGNKANEDSSPSKTPGSGQDNAEYANLTALTSRHNAVNETILQQLEENKKIMELQQQIENLQKSPRKVIQVTVYYDDSTYETFIRK